MIKRPLPARAVLLKSAGAVGAVVAGAEAAGAARVGAVRAGAARAGAAAGVGPLAQALLGSDWDTDILAGAMPVTAAAADTAVAASVAAAGNLKPT